MSSKEEVKGLDEDSDTTKIALKSKDGETFEVNRKSVSISGLISTALDNDKNATEIPVDLRGDVLRSIVEYMEFHEGTEAPIIEKPLKSKVMKEVCKDGRDAIFIDKIGEDKQRLYDVILGANYLDIKGLLHLGCAKVASLIKGQPIEKIKEILNVDSQVKK